MDVSVSSQLDDFSNQSSDVKLDYKLVSSEGLKCVYDVNIAHSRFSEVMEEFFTEKQKAYAFKSFRPGRVPLSIVRQNFTAQAFEYATQKLISQVVKNIQEQGIEYIGYPLLKVKQEFDKDDSTKNPIFEVTFNMKPQIPDFSLANIEIVNPVVEISDQNINEEMELWAKNNFKSVELTESREARTGDILSLSMSMLDSSKDQQSLEIKLGDGKLVKEIEDQLVGKSVGNVVQHTVTVPKTISKDSGIPSELKNFAGKKLMFNLTINKIMESKPHNVDLDMAKVFGCSSIESCKKKFRQMLEERVKNSSFICQKYELSSYINSNIDFEISDEFIKSEVNILWNRLLSKFGLTRKNPFTSEEIKELFSQIQKAGFLTKYEFDYLNNEYTKISLRKLKFFFVVQKLGQDLSISLTKEELENAKLSKSAELGGAEAALRYYTENREALISLENSLLEDKIVSEALLQCDVKDKHMSLTELSQCLNDAVKSLDVDLDFSIQKSQEESKPVISDVEAV
ncbi:MAG: hypothetical protein H6845_02590 [Alphaproteobacteria bacterium]|nr:MAG: hypothetical protein H6845_02590 [Alphaproteobacteria bacterium]